MRKILLIYFSFVVACIVVIAVFLTATTHTQLVVAILLYILLFLLFAFFAYNVLLIKKRQAEVTPLQEVSSSPSKLEQEAEGIKIGNRTESIGISDIDKRVFLKLIGGAGVTLFLFSLFNKRAEGLFFKNLPSGVSGSVSLQDIAGKKIDPAQKKPLDSYSISDIDNNIITFYGFIKEDGSWYIIRADTTTGAFRYTKDKSNFRANWNNRANLKYDYFDNVFRP